MRTVALASLSLAALIAAGAADAGPGYRGRPHHAHHHHPRYVARVAVFTPFYAFPRYYPAPVYVPPPVVVAPPPPVYVEQAQPQGWWYYCPQLGAYYPHVQGCPGPWQRVAPQPG